ncbi:MAG: hypothetical protein LBU23_01875 [Planctomycetota bacterium]|jgi:hypothetical protein|nr:hypothetical protein [Planctomycetota bacterium]
MCGACGVLSGGSEWLERADGPDGIGADKRVTGAAERQRRIRLVNRILARTGARLRDFGAKLMLQGPTGRTKLVDDLAHVWLAADAIGLKRVDPLDDGFLDELRSRT